MDAGDCKLLAGGDDYGISSIAVESKTRRTKAVLRYKIIKTTCLVMVSICLGMASDITATTLPDLRKRIDSTVEQFARALSLMSIGGLTGALIVGVLGDRFRKQLDLILTLLIFISGFALILRPWVPSLAALEILFLVEGFCHSSLNVVANAILLVMWGENAAVPFHALHFGFGVGLTTSSLMVRPFLSPDRENSTTAIQCFDEPPYINTLNDTHNLLNYSINISDISSPSEDCSVDQSRIEIPYSIIGGYYFFLCLLFLCFYCIPHPVGFTMHGNEKKSIKEVFSPSSCTGHSAGFAVKITILMCLFYIILVAVITAPGMFLFSYVVESDLAFTKQDAALLDATQKGGFMIGRALAIVIAHYAPIQAMLFTEIYCLTGAGLCILFLGAHNRTFMWIFSPLFYLFYAPLWPGGYSWCNKYIEVGALVVAIFDVAAGISGMFFHWFNGYLYTNISKSSILQVSSTAAILLCVLIIIMHISTCRHGNQFKQVVNSSDDKTHNLLTVPVEDDSDTDADTQL